MTVCTAIKEKRPVSRFSTPILLSSSRRRFPGIRGQITELELPDIGEDEVIDASIPADPNVKNYSYTLVNGEVYYRENSRMVRPELSDTAKERVKGMVELRDCVRWLIDQQLDGSFSDAAIMETQSELNQLYDAFTAKFSLINSRGNSLAFSDDSSYYLLCSLEVLDEDGNLERKADMFTKRTIRQRRIVTLRGHRVRSSGAFYCGKSTRGYGLYVPLSPVKRRRSLRMNYGV